MEGEAYYPEEGGRYQRVLGEVGWEERGGMVKYWREKHIILKKVDVINKYLER